MAITRTQIARQLYQFGGGADAGGKGSPGGGDFGGGGNQGGNGDARSDRMGDKGKKGPPGGLSKEARADLEAMTKGLRSSISAQNRAAAVNDFINKAKNFLPGGKFSITGALGNIFGGPKTKDNLGIEGYNMANIAGPVDRDFGPEDKGEGSLFAPLVSSAPVTFGSGTPTEGVPSTGADLNRIAYRLMADGGAVIDDEPRQAYGLGSIVKKATRAVKKVAKSPIGKAALLYTATGGLGNLAAGKGFGGFFSGFTNPTSFLGGAGKIFSKAGIQNIASSIGLGGFENVGGNRIFQANKLGSFLGSPLGIISAASAIPLLTGLGTEEDEVKEAPMSDYLTAGLEIPKNQYRLMSEGGSTDLSDDPNYKGWVKIYEKSPDAAEMNEKHSEYLNFYERNKTKQAEGSKEPVAKKVMPLLDMDGMEKDYRETGGFVDMGRMEKADDVPARLSKNEFVFTADAVRNAGYGSVDKGAEVMYNMMKNLEAGGEVSEESQGLEGARKMFHTSQRLEEVL